MIKGGVLMSPIPKEGCTCFLCVEKREKLVLAERVIVESEERKELLEQMRNLTSALMGIKQ